MNLLRRDFVVREPLLVGILVLITIVFSTLTHTYSRAYDNRRNALGQQWFAEGNRQLQKNHPDAAVEALRTALLYDPQNWEYRLLLAEALTHAGHTKQALSYYQTLWQINPKSGLVNLHLARFAANSGQVSEAERYFNGAIFSDWPENAPDHRREALFELIHFYLQRGNTGQAESQLIILSGNLPEDPVQHTRVADLYFLVGDNQRALNQYRLAFRLDPKFFPALLGAGKAAFRMGDYRAAEIYLNRALREDVANEEARNLLAITQFAAALNPWARGISDSEKRSRVLRAFKLAGARLDSCAKPPVTASTPPPSPASLQAQWKQWKPNATARYLTQHPDQLDSLFEFSVSIEKQAQSVCGPPNVADSALLALAGAHTTEEK